MKEKIESGQQASVDVLTGNKLIAEFEGLNKFANKKYGVVYVFSKDDFRYRGKTGKERIWAPEHLKYHSSWDWLMPVVENIRGFRNGTPDTEGYMFGGMAVHIHDSYPNGWCCHILGKLTIQHIQKDGTHTYSNTDAFSSANYSSKNYEFIQPIWKAVVQFIIWYNTQTKKQ